MKPPGDSSRDVDLPLPTFGDVLAAARRIHGLAHRTPVLHSRLFDEAVGAEVFFKAEPLQRAGAFKFRGAANALLSLPEETRRRGVLTFSSGNHAQAVALASRLLGISATIIMPSDAPAVKLTATREYGAEVILYDRRETTREALGARLAEERGLPIVPPYDHPDIIAGQGTAALELFDEIDDVELLLVPCGGGGLLSGSALSARAVAPGCRVAGVEPEAGDDATRSFRTGALHTVHNPDTIADGARTPSLGRFTFPLILQNVDAMHTVTDVDLIATMRFLWERLKIVVEPTGALAAAALLSGKVEAKGRRVGVILSGGNVDLSQAAGWFA